MKSSHTVERGVCVCWWYSWPGITAVIYIQSALLAIEGTAYIVITLYFPAAAQWANVFFLKTKLNNLQFCYMEVTDTQASFHNCGGRNWLSELWKVWAGGFLYTVMVWKLFFWDGLKLFPPRALSQGILCNLFFCTDQTDAISSHKTDYGGKKNSDGLWTSRDLND